ncbi:MAG: hypothetical protein SFY32_10555 [Bacteroidota bacterium]|nr:hypothetical protein [Bacteroidota bacterium]
MEKLGRLAAENQGKMKKKPISKTSSNKDFDKWFSQDFGNLFKEGKSLELDELLKK